MPPAPSDPARRGQREAQPAGDRQRLEQDRACRTSRWRRPGRPRPPATSTDGRDLGRRGTRRATTVLDRTNAAVPRSRSVATEPIVRMIAAKAPNWVRFFQSWVDGVADDRWRKLEAGQLVAAGGRDDLGQETCQQRRGETDHEEQPGDDGQTQRPPRLEKLLAQEDPEPRHQADRRRQAARPPGRPGAGRRPRATAGRARTRPAGCRPRPPSAGGRPRRRPRR